MVKSEEVYLTKRILKTVSKSSIKKAFDSSMETMGYVVMAEDGFLVRLDANGNKERLSEIKKADRSFEIVLD